MASAFFSILLPCTPILVLLLLLRRSYGSRLPPGPWGLPVLGRLPFLTTDLHRCLADVSRSYGPVSSFWVGARLFVVVSSPSAAAEVFKEHDAVFANHAGPLVAWMSTKGGKDILWSAYGAHWRFARRLVMRELLNPAVINSFQPLRRKEVRRMVSRLGGMREADIREEAALTSLAVILGMMWDGALTEDTGRLSKPAEELKELMESVVELGGRPNISDYFPALAPLDLQGLQRRMRALMARFDAVMAPIMKQKESGGGEEKSGDFLQLMLDLSKRKDLETPFDLDHVGAILLDMIIAGMDTTASTIEWAMTELVRNPEVMAKAQEELDAVVGDGGVLEESHLPRLRYLDAVVKETFRLHPIVPLLVPRTPSETSGLGGYTIPRGAWVFVNAWAIQRDPSLWERPLEFRPERFLAEEAERWEYNGRNFEFLPFGRGRRMCAGMNLGERMVTFVLATLLHSFHWDLPVGVTGVDSGEKFQIVLAKKEPLVLVPSIRREQYLSCSH